MEVDCLCSVCVYINATLYSVFVGGRENARGIDICRFECPEFIRWSYSVQTFLLGLTPNKKNFALPLRRYIGAIQPYTRLCVYSSSLLTRFK